MTRKRKPPPAVARVDMQGAAVVWWADLYARAEAMRDEFWDSDRAVLRERMDGDIHVGVAFDVLLDRLLAAMPRGACVLKLPGDRKGGGSADA